MNLSTAWSIEIYIMKKYAKKMVKLLQIAIQNCEKILKQTSYEIWKFDFINFHWNKFKSFDNFWNKILKRKYYNGIMKFFDD